MFQWINENEELVLPWLFIILVVSLGVNVLAISAQRDSEITAATEYQRGYDIGYQDGMESDSSENGEKQYSEGYMTGYRDAMEELESSIDAAMDTMFWEYRDGYADGYRDAKSGE